MVLLRCFPTPQDASYRGLVALGIGAISNTPVAAFTKADANRYTTVITNNDPAKLQQVSGAECYLVHMY